MSNLSTEEFYDDLADSYNDIIYRCAPRYEEMHQTMLEYIPSDLEPRQILDLGCGTGNLTLRVLEMFPETQVTALDLSEEILGVCRRQCGDDRITYLQQDFGQLDLPDSGFDLVVSSIAIHHIDDAAKQVLFRNVLASHATVSEQMRWLSEAGFVEVDCIWKHVLWTLLTARKSGDE